MKRDFTPEPGIYLTDDPLRAYQQYAGPKGHVTRTFVPRSVAERLHQLGPRGPDGIRQYEFFVSAEEDVKLLNQTATSLPSAQAFFEWVLKR